MKLAVALGLLAVAFASKQWEMRSENIHEKSFQAGKHYTFKFDGQISSGLPVPSSSQQSATRVQSIVSLVFENDQQALLKLQKTRFGSAHRDLVEPREVQPFGLFEEIEMNKEQQEQLALPIRFRYEQGLISEIEFDREDQAWSENIKRAVLNMLQLNLAKKSRTDEGEMVRISRDSERSEHPEQQTFSTQELTLEGDCETTYTVTPSGQQKIHVSKSINFNKCAKRVDIRYNFLSDKTDSCGNMNHGNEQSTESSTVLNFELNGNTEEFVIREVELRSQHLFAPLSKDQQQMSTFVANKLTLVKVDGEKNAVRAPKSEKTEKLAYSTEWEEALEQFQMTGEESLLKQSPYTWMDKKVEIAKNAISHLRREITEQEKVDQVFQPEVVRQIARLVEVLRVSTKNEIISIEKEMNKEERLSGLFYDILAQTGTKTAVDVLANKMAERKISTVQAVKLFKILMNLRNPSEQIIETLVRLQKEEIVARQPAVKQSLWLTIGALMHVQCGDEHSSNFVQEISFEKQQPICPRRLKQKYVEILENFLEKAETRYEKILALKSIANAGFDLVIFPLEKIIRDEREEKSVRVQAIDAVRKLRQLMPRKIQAVLLPVYKNIREYPELRIAAFHQLMQTVPERAVIDQITQQLEREPSHEVHSFVYSTLQAYAKSELPSEKDLARNIQTSLKLARVQPRKMLQSALLRASLYSEKYTSGAAINWAVMFSNDSVLPKEIMASLDTVFGGDWNKYVAQLGFAQQNLDQILYKLLEKLENNEYSLEDVVVRGKRSTSVNPAEALKQLMKKMGIQQRRFSSEEPHALVYLRYRDNDFAVLPIEEETIKSLAKEVIKGGKIHMGELERVLSNGYRFEAQLASFIFEKTRVLATAIGMPLEITGKMPTYITVEGEIKAELEPKTGNGLQGARVHIKAQPKLASTHIVHMEVRSPVHSQGVKMLHSVNLYAPIDATMEMNWEKNFDAKLTIRAPENREQSRVLSLISRPATYVRFEAEEERSQSALEKTHYIGEQPRVELDRVYGEKIFGLRFNVRGNIHRHLYEKMQQTQNKPIQVSENHIEVVMEKTGETPREYVIRMNVAPYESEKMISERPQFEQFYEQDSENHFEVEDSEFMNEDEQERRGSFNKYAKEYKNGAGYKHRVHLKAYTVGSSQERKGEMEVKTVCDQELTYCKWTVEAQRSPLLEGERRDWTLSAEFQTLFPQPVVSLQQLKEQKNRELVAILEAKWGSEEKNMIKMRIQGEQSKEQKKWQRLIQNKSEKKMIESLETLELASRLNQIKISAEYKIQPETLVQIDRISNLLKSYNPLSSSVEIRDVRKSYNKEGRLLAQITVEPQTWRYVNVSIVTPSERVQLENIRLPFRPTFLSIYKSENGLRQFSPVCEVSSSRINTFDEIIYRAPLTTCYSVLAKDCSEEPKFAVLMKKIQKNGEEKKLKIVTEESTIEIENKNGELKVNINGKNVEDEQKLQTIGLEKKYDVVIFENEDIFVRFDGYKAEIKLNKYYKNKQCGICGHFDGESEGEFRRADDIETEDIEEFHRSYLSRDEECDVEEDKLSEKKNYKKYERFEQSEENSWESEEDQEYSPKNKFSFNKYEENDDKQSVEPVEKTRVIEYSNRVCFSQQPIPECPRKTFSGEETKEIKAKFSCVDRSSSEARRLLRDSRREILSIENLPVSFVETIVVPKTCVVY